MAMTYLYHKDFPGGKIFDLDDKKLKELEAEGWVDSPEKLYEKVTTKPKKGKKGAK